MYKKGSAGFRTFTRGIAGFAAALMTVSAMTAAVSAYNDEYKYGQYTDKGYCFAPASPWDAAAEGTSVEGYAGFGETINTKFLSTTLVGIAGDEEQPELLVDVRINDKKFAKKYDRFFIVTKTIGAEEFEDGLIDNYGPNYGFAVQDDADPTLYHIRVDAPAAWITGGEETVFTIESVHGYSSRMLRKYGVTEQEVEDYWNNAKRLPDSKEEVFMTFREYDIDDIMYRFIVPGDVFGNSDAPSYGYDTASADELYRYAGVGETINTTKFSTTLVGVSGMNTDQPRIHVDLRVNDSSIAAKYDIFFITGRTLGADVFDSDKRDNYGIDHGFGVRDAKDPDLYHLTIDGKAAWMSKDQVTVFEIQSVTAYSSRINARYGLTAKDLEDSWQYAKPLSNEKMGGINAFEKYDLDIQYRFIVK